MIGGQSVDKQRQSSYCRSYVATGTGRMGIIQYQAADTGEVSLGGGGIARTVGDRVEGVGHCEMVDLR